ncbi:MAG: FAD binding domain-containing protein, partial [Vulcanimicrobiaceae bacterium]
FTTILEPDEIVVSATFPAAESGWGYAFEEFAERHGDFAIVATACALRVDEHGALAELRLAIGGVDERPVQPELQRYCGRTLDASAIGEIAVDVSRALEPPSDRRGNARYRHFLCRNQIARVVARALDEACA